MMRYHLSNMTHQGCDPSRADHHPSRAEFHRGFARYPAAFMSYRLDRLAAFTGIDAPYEVPEEPDLVLDTSQVSLGACVGSILDLVA